MRLVIQTLKDVGYVYASDRVFLIWLLKTCIHRATAATLEDESGFSFETARVAAFRTSVMEGDWGTAEKGLSVLGVRDEDALRVSLLYKSSHARVLTLLEHAGCPLPY